MQRQICNITVREDSTTSLQLQLLQLLIYTRQEAGSESVTKSIVPSLANHPALTLPVLDPDFLMHKVVGSFEI